MEIRRSWWVLLAAGLLQQCNETLEPDYDSLGIQHFPVALGEYRDYQVRQILYRFNGDIDTAYFLLREQVVDSFTNEEGGATFVLDRSTRPDSTQAWQKDSVWSIRKTNYQAIQTESNVPFVKLVFPAMEGKSWDGNLLNGSDPDEYRMVDVFQPFQGSGGSEQYPNTITVIQNDYDDGITRTDIRTEVYALHVGLVSKSFRKVSFCTDPECLGQEIIELGEDWNQQLIGFGTE